MLHVANGESTAVLLRQAGLEGSVVDGDDLWMEGPWGAPPEVRARELERRFGIPAGDVPRKEREAALAAALRAPEVTFWTEEDLFCQANLCEALRRFPPRHPGVVWLASPERPEERLGHLPPEALAARFAARAPLTDARLRLAHRAAEAFASPDPREVEALLSQDLSEWPALAAGLRAHLRRFPSASHGLDVVEEETLRALDASGGPVPFGELFAALQRSPRFWSLGLGDVQLAAALREMGPLVRLERDGAGRTLAAATAEGRAALAGAKDALDVRPLDRWLGGVHLRGRDVWRWDEETGRLRPPAASGPR